MFLPHSVAHECTSVTLAALLQNVVRLVQEVLQVVVQLLQGLIAGLSGIIVNLGLGPLADLGL